MRLINVLKVKHHARFKENFIHHATIYLSVKCFTGLVILNKNYCQIDDNVDVRKICH
mgnify:CR=1 FL=1